MWNIRKIRKSEISKKLNITSIINYFMGLELLFVYGTLMKPDVQKQEIGRVTESLPDILKGYRKSKVKIDNNEYPIITPSTNLNDFIKGCILLVTPAELELLDEYETKAYERKKVILSSGREAWTYVKPSNPEQAIKEMMEEGRKLTYSNFF